MKSNLTAAILLVALVSVTIALIGCSKSHKDVVSEHQKGMPMEHEAVSAGDSMVACAYDGMHMKQRAMQATLEREGETLYFCTEGHKTLFQESPEKYRKEVDLGAVKAIVNILPASEYMTVMSDMGMKMDMNQHASHHVGVTLIDSKTGNSIEGAGVIVTVNAPEGKKDVALDYMPMMKHYGSAVDLPSGDYDLGVQATCDGETTEGAFNYSTKSS